MTVTVNSNGQITIPAKIRKQMGVRPGVEVSIVLNDDGSASIIPAQPKIHRSELHKHFPTDVIVSETELDSAFSEGYLPSEFTND